MFLFFAEILYLLLTARLKPSANLYFMAGCDTAMHLGARRSAQLHHSAHRGFVGGHMVVTMCPPTHKYEWFVCCCCFFGMLMNVTDNHLSR
jgi:hypothetical protein